LRRKRDAFHLQAVKRTVKIRRKKGKQQGKNYIRGAVLGLEVEPTGSADNFFADSLSAGETKLEAGSASQKGKAALGRGISAMKMVSINCLFEPFMYQNEHFTKTGSDKHRGKYPKITVFPQAKAFTGELPWD
jgi:hypothetical protein